MASSFRTFLKISFLAKSVKTKKCKISWIKHDFFNRLQQIFAMEIIWFTDNIFSHQNLLQHLPHAFDDRHAVFHTITRKIPHLRFMHLQHQTCGLEGKDSISCHLWKYRNQISRYVLQNQNLPPVSSFQIYPIRRACISRKFIFFQFLRIDLQKKSIIFNFLATKN